MDPRHTLTDAELLDAYAPPEGDAPFVRFNFVSTLDGAATHDGASGALGSPADQRIFALLRRWADVILVGAGTVRAEGYEGPLVDAAGQAWRAAHGLPAHPAVAVVSAELDLDPASAFFRDAPVRPLILTDGPTAADGDTPAEHQRRARALARVADVVVLTGDDDGQLTAAALKAALTERGLRMIHAEGGPRLFGAFVAEDAVDSLCLTLSPLLAGGSAGRISASAAEGELRRLRLHHVLTEDDSLFLEYRR